MRTGIRWLNAYHLLFFACLAVSVVTMAVRAETPLTDQGLTLGLTILMALWYTFFIIRRPDRFELLNPMAAHFLVLLALLFVLIRREPVYEITMYGMCAVPYVILPKGWNYLGAVLVVLITWTARDLFRGADYNSASVASTLASTALVLIIGLFVNFLAKQSDEGKARGVLEERARLAREIHDTLAQGFSGIITQLEAAEQAIEQGSDNPASVRERITAAKQLARDNLNEARRSVDALRPEPLAATHLDGALAAVTERWQSTTGIPVTFSLYGSPRPLGTEAETTLLRAAQEGLTNITKHAGAGQVALTLSYMEDEVTLDVLDDGVGFDPAKQYTGYGLVAMRERMARTGGTITVESAQGEGTTLCLSIPFA